MAARKTEVHGYSLWPGQHARLTAIAVRERKNRSELVRAALEQFFRRFEAAPRSRARAADQRAIMDAEATP